MEQSWKPKTWIAVILGFLGHNFAFLYTNNQRLFWLYFIPIFIVGFIDWKNETLYYGLFYILFPIHAYLISSTFSPISNRSWYSRWWGFIIYSLVSILLIGTFILVTRVFFFEPFSIPASSMAPTINIGNQIIVNKYGYNTYGTFDMSISNGVAPDNLMERGEMYVFYPPNNSSTLYVKRLIGKPGDTISISEDSLIVNGITLVTTEIKETEDHTIYEEILAGKTYLTQYNHWTYSTDMNEVVVPENSYFFMGDNRDNSNDSRYFGFVSNEQIIGRVIYTLN